MSKMPKLNCMGELMTIPNNGKICPNLPTSIVPMGTKCEVSCSSGSANVEYLKCDNDGWSPAKEVTCSGPNTAMVVGLVVGCIFAVVIIAYIYAKVKLKRKNKEQGKLNSTQPVSRAAKIAAVNDMKVTGVVTPDLIKSGVVQQPHRGRKGKLVTGVPDEPAARHSSSSSQNMSSPPSYHSYDYQEDPNYDGNPHRSRKSKHHRNMDTTEMQPIPHKQRSFHDEYSGNMGYQEGPAAAVFDGQYHSTQETGPMYPDYYGPRSNMHHGYGTNDQNYYPSEMGGYPGHYGMDNMGYVQGTNYQKPYRVPV